MSEPDGYWRSTQDGEVLVGFGRRVLFCFDERDLGMRNLAVVALTRSGAKGLEVAKLFGLSGEHVSRLRGRAASGGSRALVPPRGAPRKLTVALQRRAVAWSRDGVSGAEIARRLGVSQATISRMLARAGGTPQAQLPLGLEAGEQPQEHEQEERVPAAADAQPASEVSGVGEQLAAGTVEIVERAGQGAVALEACQASSAVQQLAPAEAGAGQLPRLAGATVASRYAGAMLLHPFLCELGADQVLGALSSGAARRYDGAAVVLASSFAFALGSGSVEATKHLVVKDAGALIGLRTFPHLRTLRPRLAALADASDPLALQRSFATAMLAADEHPPEVFYVDDHFVTYWGQRPVAKGYNVRRHLAEPGRDDTLVVDHAWRAICFSSSDPRGLSVTLPEVLAQLKEIVGERRVMIGFDRGGSYPKVFAAITAAGMDWVTWRRAPLATPAVAPKRSWVNVEGKRRYYLLADEQVALDGYAAGTVRQLSAYEHDKVVFQVLSSSRDLCGGAMVHRLRGRWCIENTNKYLEQHHGIHWLCSYEMDLEANTAKVKNPARRTARANAGAAEAALASAERTLGQHAATHNADSATHNALTQQITNAKDDLATAKAAVKQIPAKLPANELDPNAQRAHPRLATRALQMVCRLLAYNAELDLARRLNTYLGDPDEYRAITRNLLHLSGTITYQTRQVTVTLNRPDTPRIAHALHQLINELNTKPAHLPGDHRPINYQIDQPG
jgi:transposase